MYYANVVLKLTHLTFNLIIKCVVIKCMLFVVVVVSGLPQHSLIHDVKTRWNSLYLIVERFMEHDSAIQALALDP